MMRVVGSRTDHCSRRKESQSSHHSANGEVPKGYTEKLKKYTLKVDVLEWLTNQKL